MSVLLLTSGGTDNLLLTSGDDLLLAGTATSGDVAETFPAFSDSITATSAFECAAGVGSNAYECTVLSHCPVVYWPANDQDAPTATPDISGNGYDGSGFTRRKSSSLIDYDGAAFRWLDTNEAITGHASMKGLGPYTEYTWLLWYEYYDSGSFNDTLIAAAFEPDLWFRNANGTLTVNGPGSSQIEYAQTNLAGYPGHAGGPVFLAVVYSGTDATLRLFVDGTEVASDAGTGGSYTFPNDTDPSWRLGLLRTDNVNGAQDIHIDEVAFIPKALSASEVSALYDCGSTADHANCIPCQVAAAVFIDTISVGSAGIGVGA